MCCTDAKVFNRTAKNIINKIISDLIGFNKMGIIWICQADQLDIRPPPS